MVYLVCIIYMFNLFEKIVKRDIIYGIKYLEEIVEDWLCVCRILFIFSVFVWKWNVEFFEEVFLVFNCIDEKYGMFSILDVLLLNKLLYYLV